MSIPSELQELFDNDEEYNAAAQVKGSFQGARTAIQTALAKFTEVVNEYGDFPSLPDTTKAAFVATKNVLQTASDSMDSDADITTLLDWRPGD